VYFCTVFNSTLLFVIRPSADPSTLRRDSRNKSARRLDRKIDFQRLMSFVQSQIVVKMKEIKFNPNGADLQARVLFKGLIVAGYSLRLYERDSNRIVIRRSGNNVNPEMNIHDLPSPAKDNIGRVFRLLTDLRGFDPVESPQYKIILEIYQGGVLLGEETEEGLITGGVQESRINLKLIANT